VAGSRVPGQATGAILYEAPCAGGIKKERKKKKASTAQTSCNISMQVLQCLYNSFVYLLMYSNRTN